VAVAHVQVPLLLAAESTRFDASLLALGLLLVMGALVSGLAGRSFLSLTALFVLIGFGLGPGGTDVIHLDAQSSFVGGLATVALIVILFRDGLEVDGEMLQKHWRLPLRKLVLAMPLTAIIVAIAAHVMTDLNWTESFLLGALLSPTDPVLSSSVVTNPRVPAVIRHSLNLESGLNDGLALPAVLAFAAALSTSSRIIESSSSSSPVRNRCWRESPDRRRNPSRSVSASVGNMGQIIAGVPSRSRNSPGSGSCG